MADWIAEGAKAPDFTLTNHDGSKRKLPSLRGRPVELSFYPKDDNPDCTREAGGTTVRTGTSRASGRRTPPGPAAECRTRCGMGHD